MSAILLGCVGDDFSGSSDAASFFPQEGVKTLLFNGTPKQAPPLTEDCAAVIALKTRTQETGRAVADTLGAFDWLRAHGARQLFVKYCSTFDSTPAGNIGPIADAVMEKYAVHYTILCPALPVNGRTVENGHLLVGGIPLHLTHMKDHPLTPMWDSDLEKLMAPQSKYPCMKIGAAMLEKSKAEILAAVEDFGRGKAHFYVIPDYVEARHGDKIVEVFGDLPLLTGGSGLMTALARQYLRNRARQKADTAQPLAGASGPALLLAGSCSKATLEQVEDFIGRKNPGIKIDPEALLSGSQTKEELWQRVAESDAQAVLAYSSDTPDNVRRAQASGSARVSGLLEETSAYLARRAVESGYTRIIVAGGETSGAVTKALGYDAYLVGRSIAPGVPVMAPLTDTGVRLVLKSGNFGQRDFFTRAVQMTGEEL